MCNIKIKYNKMESRKDEKFMNLSKIGKFIAECRKNQKLTQEQLAEKLLITNRAVSKWERGLSLPDASIMLELCNILDINVIELLNGEKIKMNDYKEKNEELLIELARQDEEKNKKIMAITMISSLFCILAYLTVVILSASILKEGTLFEIIMCVSTILFITAVFVINKYEVESGYHACKHCNHKFVTTYKQALMAPHMGYTRYLRCPKCGKKSWAKKVMTK